VTADADLLDRSVALFSAFAVAPSSLLVWGGQV